MAEVFGAAPILLLDEVAAHLDEARRQALYAEISGLGAQAWMTGTGEELFDGLEAQRLEVSEAGGASRVRPPRARKATKTNPNDSTGLPLVSRA